MPIYEFEINGKTYEIDAAQRPSGAQMRSVASRMGGQPRKPASPDDFTDRKPAPQGSAVSRAASGAWEMLNPITALGGLAQAVASPIETGKALIGAQIDQGRKAVDAVREGRYVEAAGHAGGAILPVLGPMAAGIGEDIAESGDIATGVGRVAGAVVPVLGARTAITKAQGVGAKTGAAVKAALDPGAAVMDAVRWGLQNGVPVDAATATGNRVVRGVKELADRGTLGGVGSRARQMREESMAKLGKGLGARASVAAETPETAGAAVRGGVEGAITKAAREADAAYAKVRAAGDPVVNLAPAKAALKPIYDALMKKRELTGQLLGAEGRAAVALDALVSGADEAPLSVVDAALGDIKGLARGAEMPELRSAGQGLAAEAVKNLETAVQDTAKAAGVWDDLRAGRDATIAKWTAAETRDALRAEPVQTFRALTQAGDAAIDKLRDVKKIAPAEMPKIGRAYLDDLIDTATAEGGFSREAKLWAEWSKLGDETKALIFPDASLRGDLDQFFLLGKKMAENPNPSGTGSMVALGAQGAMLWTDPVTGVATALSGAALSKALNSPAVAKLLTQAMQTPRTATAARSLGARLKVALKKVAPAAPTVGQATARTPAGANP
jgi:hypothetical protein